MPQPEISRQILADLQSVFLHDVTGGEVPAGLTLCFETPPGDTLETRLDIYRSGYLARLVEAVESDYPAVRRILGAGAFGSLVSRYVRSHPPRTFEIGRAGDRLPTFLDGDLLTRDLPFLPDLARLEWALRAAFVAPDATPLAWADLAALDADAVAAAVFRLLPSVAIVASRFPLVELRAARERSDEEVSVPIDESPRPVLVYREGLEVRYRVIGEADADFLRVAGRGLRLADLAMTALSEADADATVARFRMWVSAGLFAPPDDAPESGLEEPGS